MIYEWCITSFFFGSHKMDGYFRRKRNHKCQSLQIKKEKIYTPEGKEDYSLKESITQGRLSLSSCT